jgi:V/A-type H+-transporting ATPase subunit C
VIPDVTLGVTVMVLAITGSVIVFIPILKNILEIAPYMYTNAKIRAMEAGLLKKDKIDTIADSKDVIDCVSSLEDTDYGPYITKITEPITSIKVEAALNKHLTDIYSKVVKTVPIDISDIFSELTKIWDAKNIKTCIRLAYAQIPVEKREAYLVNAGTLKHSVLKSMTESSSMADVVSSLENTEYGSTLSAAIADSKDKNNLLPLEAAVDKYVFERIYKKVSTAKDTHMAVVQMLIGTKIDLLNIRLILRGIAEKIDTKLLEKYMIDASYNLGEGGTKELLKLESLDELVSYLENTPYTEVMAGAVDEFNRTGSLTLVEKQIHEYYLSFAKKLSLRYSLSVGPALSLLAYKEADVQRIVAIVKFKGEKLGKEELMEVLI